MSARELIAFTDRSIASARAAPAPPTPGRTGPSGAQIALVDHLPFVGLDFEADLGQPALGEWRASRAADEENAEREMRQFVWCLPVLPPSLSDMALDANEIVNRTLRLRRGVAPRWTKTLTCGVDLGKYLAHWIVVAWGEDASCHVVDYGRIEVATDDLGVEQALMVTLRQMRDLVQTGWPIEAKANETICRSRRGSTPATCRA